jgi:hypothetical protein
MKHELTKRIGKFTIRKHDLDACAGWIQDLMARVIIVKAEFAFERDGIEYTAFCHEFEKIDLGQEAPRYLIAIKDDHFEGWSK